ncbi:HAD-IA family hydrolase [Rheinheimera maricola]|uniref:HAD-IA family hydrolase n=1 Tax=Rheinheimera maricola TaxID=2793282 RepID=A0ABS7XE09_9GAMM|nr:HAD-IA family hydrolase [Rheinheimera maricola]MBZ9613809.1 HAD-IA family hydrolase [Rheinheimera maricola]
MQLFKALAPISVLSFDLDDTLYDNKPVIAAAEQAMLNALAQHASVTKNLHNEFWWQQRRLLANTTPDIRHDIGRWRLLGIEAGLVSLGLAQCEASDIAELAYQAFLAERTRISVSSQVKQLLSALAQRYKLIAITNGNACINKMGIGELFEFSLQAGPDGRKKPYADLYLAAAERLQVKPSAILHIGDSHRADVMGALNAGCQAAWLDHYGSVVPVLPHIRFENILEISSIVA